MLLGLLLGNYFVPVELSLVGVSLVIVGGLKFCTGEGSLDVLSLGLPLGSPLESPNTGAVIFSTIGSKAVR